MSYSRRQLYALGETFGESATRHKVGGRIYGGGGTPTSQQQSNNVLSPYAASYGQDLLGKAQALTSTTYQPYTSGQAGPSGQVAGFSDLQNQSFDAAKNQGTAPQLDIASNMAGTAGMGAFGTAQQALGYGGMGAQAGMSYGQNATNPSAVQSYMNPYLQASLAPQMQLLNQQQGMQQQANQGQAVQAGAFGGSRMGVQNALQNQSNQLAMSNLVGQGYNQAYNTANQNMQQAATLGMQGANAGLAGISGAQAGLNTANTAASNLANIGNTQYNQQMGITNQQNQLGAQQQQYQQNLDTAAYQAYQNQQQLPYQQLGFMSNIMQGLPVSGQQQSVYSTPNPLSVAAGLGTAAVGASKLKKGGEVKMAAGGLVSLALSRMA